MPSYVCAQFRARNERKSNPMSNVFTIDGHEFDLATVPQVGLLAQRAIAHIVRNEASSRVRSALVAEARDAKRKASKDPKAELTDDERRAIKYNAESPEHKALYAKAQSDMAEVIRSGKIGES